MLRNIEPSFPLGIVILFSCLALAGCQRSSAPVEESRLSKLAVYYGRYMGRHEGKPPANEQQLKDFIKGLDADINLDELFVSPRDRQSYVVRYGVQTGTGGESVTAHEKTGVDGKRMVALTTGEVRTVDEGEFQKLLGASSP